LVQKEHPQQQQLALIQPELRPDFATKTGRRFDIPVLKYPYLGEKAAKCAVGILL
jgi:hypothetical protein